MQEGEFLRWWLGLVVLMGFEGFSSGFGEDVGVNFVAADLDGFMQICHLWMTVEGSNSICDGGGVFYDGLEWVFRGSRGFQR